MATRHPWGEACSEKGGSQCGGIGLTFHYIYGFRGAAHEAQTRQRKVEKYAERTKELV
jgi:hypothetical protein